MTSAPTVLLLDEEPMLRNATARMLSSRGARVSAAASAEEAIALASHRTFDVAIVEAGPGMPPLDEVLRSLRDRARTPRKVIVCTDAPDAVALAGEAADVLVRPFPFPRLLRDVFGPRARRRVALAGTLTARGRPRRGAPERLPPHATGSRLHSEAEATRVPRGRERREGSPAGRGTSRATRPPAGRRAARH